MGELGRGGNRLIDAPNTHNSALLTLEERGYSLGIYPATLDGESGDTVIEDSVGFWWAKKADREFVAGDPLALLGLTALWEHRGDKWWRDGDPDIYSRILDEE